MGLVATISGHGPHRGARKGALDGGNIWWVAPSYKVAQNEIWPNMKRTMAPVAVERDLAEKWFELPGGGRVTMRTAVSEESLRSAGLDGVVVDEAALISNPKVWYEALRPALMDKQGWAILITTPNGYNWFEQLFRHAGHADGWARWQRPSWDNPLNTPEEVEALRIESLERGPHAFAQEIEARFMAIEGAEFPADYFGEDLFVREASPHYVGKVTALDPSKGKDARVGDYSAFVTATLSKENLIYVHALLDRLPAEQVVSAASAMSQEHKPDAFVVEVNQWQDLLAGMIERQFQADGAVLSSIVPIDNRVKKEVRIRRIGALLAQRRLRFVDSPGTRLLVNQLREFPVGEHDDGPDSLEMALRVLGDVIGGNSPEQVAGTVEYSER